MRAAGRTLAVLLAVVAGFLAAMSVPAVDAQTTTSTTLVAAGDISPDPFRPHLGGEDDNATADLIERINPTKVLPLGDIQYEFGKLEAFQHPDGYAHSWGRPAIKAKSCPISGNHEYWTTPFASGFHTYFAAQLAACADSGRPDLGYYAFNLGGWRWYALNSDCNKTAPSSPDCGPNDAQVKWLQQDLGRNAGRRCIGAYWHVPRWGSGWFVDNPSSDYFVRALNHVHADLVLAGHEHHYARFQALTWDGKLASQARGMRYLTIGSGGRSINRFRVAPHTGTVYRNDTDFGVLKLTLRPDGYTSSFHTTDGRVLDAHAAGCWT